MGWMESELTVRLRSNVVNTFFAKLIANTRNARNSVLVADGLKIGLLLYPLRQPSDKEVFRLGVQLSVARKIKTASRIIEDGEYPAAHISENVREKVGVGIEKVCSVGGLRIPPRFREEGREEGRAFYQC